MNTIKRQKFLPRRHRGVTYLQVFLIALFQGVTELFPSPASVIRCWSRHGSAAVVRAVPYPLVPDPDADLAIYCLAFGALSIIRFL